MSRPIPRKRDTHRWHHLERLKPLVGISSWESNQKPSGSHGHCWVTNPGNRNQKPFLFPRIRSPSFFCFLGVPLVFHSPGTKRDILFFSAGVRVFQPSSEQRDEFTVRLHPRHGGRTGRPRRPAADRIGLGVATAHGARLPFGFPVKSNQQRKQNP